MLSRKCGNCAALQLEVRPTSHSVLRLQLWIRFLLMCSRRCAILCLPAKFCSNLTIGGGVMTSSIFQDGGHRVGNLLSRCHCKL